jgi:hypothetical protein
MFSLSHKKETRDTPLRDALRTSRRELKLGVRSLPELMGRHPVPPGAEPATLCTGRTLERTVGKALSRQTHFTKKHRAKVLHFAKLAHPATQVALQPENALQPNRAIS